MKSGYLLSLAVVVSCSAASAAFKLAPIPADMLMDHSDVYCVSRGGDSPFTKEPEYKGEAEYGQTHFQGQQLKFVAFSSTGGAKDKLIIDLNGNGDVTDDVQFTVSKPTAVTMPNGTSVKLILNKPDEKRPRFYTLRRTEWYRGRVKIGDGEYDAAIMDMEMNGLDSKGQDLMLVDLNGDGVFKFDTSTFEMEGVVPLGKRVVLKDDVWNMKVDEDVPDVTFTPYAGDCGRLETKLDLGIPPSRCSVMGVIMNQDFPYILNAEDGAPSSQLPAGSYEMSMFYVTILEDGKRSAQLQYRSSDALKIEKEKVATIVLGKPGAMTVNVSQRGNKLSVSHKLKAGEGASLSSIMTADEGGKMSRPKPPRVEVRSVKTGDIVAEGNMEYG